ncbi:hypothetical protein E4U22_004486 [Claviceps purpurea]|uniref:Uncharacterized protein n=1 Tax=Claviceps purpurea (strain 20.1) TaxID=1111077 RepID=M1VZK7_CLAP2|nr:hypothetical protein E4U38_003059 [Claviceps purpurea]CCE28231.1 uncharacterized protein CPUR_01705 [Claviceps purpurea 20.1]KAG6147016.1 hypothetical protein E4U28_007881 [Claviceps purpurea]KAG6158732.1 hypothetical protein E4U11_004588 [Claviceps purpurea]KAG6226319.1 hypothetical protein E4U34_007062 [Claviceps purpurea]
MNFLQEDREHPLLSADEDDTDFEPLKEGIVPQRRLATLYDAVAGKITKDHLIRNDELLSRGKTPLNRIIRYPTRGGPLGPDEVLFRRKDAPQRYAEHDVYYSHDRDLPHGGQGILPESDLLKSIHTYSSRFYAAMERRQRRDPQVRCERGSGSVDERSMDETALLAFGILLEEAGSEVLGRKGDCVFTEGVGAGLEGPRGMMRKESKDDTGRWSSSAVGTEQAEPTSSSDERTVKRRRVTRGSSRGKNT